VQIDGNAHTARLEFANYATYIVAVLSAASHYEVGPICDVRLDCAHSYKFGVIGSTCKSQFSSFDMNEALRTRTVARLPRLSYAIPC